MNSRGSGSSGAAHIRPASLPGTALHVCLGEQQVCERVLGERKGKGCSTAPSSAAQLSPGTEEELPHLVRHLGKTLTFGIYLHGCEILIELE